MQQLPHNISIWRIFVIFLRLGCTSFGGPVAHLGFFRQEFVIQKRWLCDDDYASLVALCQLIPGPASSQVGIALGLRFAGYPGAIVAFLGFTMPSVILMVLFALNINVITDIVGLAWVNGLKLVAAAVVAQACFGMAISFCHSLFTQIIALSVIAVTLFFTDAWVLIVCMFSAGVMSWGRQRLSSNDTIKEFTSLAIPRVTKICLSAFFLLLLLLPLLNSVYDNQVLRFLSGIYQSGALVFGGGHVVLPLLQSEVVVSGFVSNEAFLAGYGAAQAIPGPLFTFAAYLGASAEEGMSGWAGALLACIAIFLPAWLLVLGLLPVWQGLQQSSGIQSSLVGINACVVGILAAALINPIMTSSITSISDAILVVLGFFALVRWKVHPLYVVLFLPIIYVFTQTFWI